MTSVVTEPSEAHRSYCGLSRTQWAALTELRTPEELIKRYDEFLQSLLKSVNDEFERAPVKIGGTEYLSTIQTAAALGVDAFHLSTMRSRKKLEGTKHGRRTFYSKEQLTNFLTADSESAERKSALALAFIRLVEREVPSA